MWRDVNRNRSGDSCDDMNEAHVDSVLASN